MVVKQKSNVAQFLRNFPRIDEYVYVRAYRDGKGINKKYRFDDINVSELTRLNQDGFNIAFVVNGQGYKAADILVGLAVFAEFDKDEQGNPIPMDEQLAIPRRLGLPEPTVVVFTGHKSLHQYWVLDMPVMSHDWKQLQTDLVTYLGSDSAIKDVSRCMRLPGFVHPKTGMMSDVYGGCDKRYSFRELRTVVPRLTKGNDTQDIDFKIGSLDEAVDELEALGLRGTNLASDASVKRLRELEEAVPGTRHNTLVNCAFSLGCVVVEDGLDVEYVYEQAAACVASWESSQKTHDTLRTLFLMGVAKGISKNTPTLGDDTETIHQHLNPTPDFTLEAKDLEHGKYLKPEHFGLYPHLAIKAPMGTGKTTCLNEVTKDKSVLVVSFRTCLCGDLSARLDLVMYSTNQASDRQVTTIDSLHKFRSRVFDVVIIDEVGQAVKYLCFSKTDVKAHRLETVEILQELLRSATNTYYLDANLDSTTMKFIHECGIDVKLVQSLYKAERNSRICFTHNNMTSLLKSLYADIDAGRKVLIMCDTQKQVDQLRKHLEMCRDGVCVLSVHGGNSGRKEQQDFINNPVEVFKRYDVVIGSPSIYTGIDINTPDVTHVYMVVKDWGGLTALDNLQAMARVRQASEAHVFLYPRRFETGEVETDLDYTETSPKSAYIYSKFAHFLGCIDELRQMHDILTQHTRALMYQHLTEVYGYKLTPASEPTDSEMIEALTIAEAEAKEETVQRVLGARGLTESEHARLQAKVNRRIPLTEQESYEHIHFVVAKHFKEVTQQTVSFFFDYGYDKMERFSYGFIYTEDMARFSDTLEQYRNIMKHDQSNWSELHNLLHEVSSVCFDDDGNLCTFYDKDVDLSQVRIKYKKLVATLTNRRPPKTDTGLLRTLLGTSGLRLESTDTRLRSEKVTRYQITQESYDFMLSISGMHRFHWDTVKSTPVRWLGSGTKLQRELSSRAMKVKEYGVETGWLP